MEYEIIRLGDYPSLHYPIRDFAEARNSFLDKLDEDEWILFVDNDEQASQMLLNYLTVLEPKYPYYWIRMMQLCRGRYVSWMNPHMESRLMSGKVRYEGRPTKNGYVMEGPVKPRDPHGMIDYPIIHDHDAYDWSSLPTRQKLSLRFKKMVEMARGR